jgi:hypothetical protein
MDNVPLNLTPRLDAASFARVGAVRRHHFPRERGFYPGTPDAVPLSAG